MGRRENCVSKRVRRIEEGGWKKVYMYNIPCCMHNRKLFNKIMPSNGIPDVAVISFIDRVK